MPASQQDLDAVHDIVVDATRLLEWCAGPHSYLEDDDHERPVLPEDLVGAYREALDQAQEDHFALALRTLRGQNQDFPEDAVARVLESAAWTGALRHFKLGVLAASGRREVMAIAGEGRAGGRGIRRRIFRRFVAVLNAALDSLDGIPGVGAIKELKDFVERASEA